MLIEQRGAAAWINQLYAKCLQGFEHLHTSGSISQSLASILHICASSKQRRLIAAKEQVCMPKDVPQRCDVLQEAKPARQLPHALQDELNELLFCRIRRGATQSDGLAKHKVDHRLHAPRNVILNHDLALRRVRAVNDALRKEQTIWKARSLSRQASGSTR
jgi:hypothetical protein